MLKDLHLGKGFELGKPEDEIVEKVFFYPGDIVQLRQCIDNKPSKMIVSKTQSMTIKTDNTSKKQLLGIVCRWFTTDGALQEAMFSSKDLIKLNYE